MRLFSVPNKESFAEFILASDGAVWEVIQDVQAKKDRLRKLNQLKSK